jgi:hypothetical protein
VEALARDGAYHSQFVTGTSNGGLTAHPGGEGRRCQSRIFGGAYDAPAAERPVHGAPDFRHQVVGRPPVRTLPRPAHRGGARPRHLLLSGRTARPRARGRPACPG